MVGKLMTFDSKQIAHAYWLTDWLTRWLDRSDWDDWTHLWSDWNWDWVRTWDHGPDRDWRWIGLGFELTWRRKLLISILTLQRYEKDNNDFHDIGINFYHHLLYVKRNASYDTRINPLHETTKFSKQIVGVTIKHFISLSSFNVVVAWTPMTWNFVRSLLCCALLTNLCCSTAALYYYALLSRCMTVLR